MKNSKAGVSDTLVPAMWPAAQDYTFMWWAYGWRGRSPEGRKTLCFQTGRYGLAIDPEAVQLLHLGPLPKTKPYAEAALQENSLVFALPKAALEVTVRVGEDRYRCVRGATHQEDRENFPIRLIESGRFVQRSDILNLEFENASGQRLKAEGRMEIVAWPDRVAFLVDLTLEQDLGGAVLEIALNDGGKLYQGRANAPEGEGWKSGEKRTAWVALSPGAAEPEAENAQALVSATGGKEGKEAVSVTYDTARGWHTIALPQETWKENQDLDHLDRVRVRLSNPAEKESVLRLLFARDHSFPGVTGLTPMLRDAEGNPTGIPVQISKNWHKAQNRTFLYEGPWFHGFTMLRLPPKSSVEMEFNMAYGRWGGLPAASHAQLCLIGWGTNQLWDQAAIGSWGESICYDPDVCLNRSMIDDVRPLMVWQMNAKQQKWSWTNNVGGGDFLVYFDGKGQKQFLTRMRTAYLSYGPNLTRVLYAGVSADGHIAARIEVSSPRSDDINRSYHRFRYDVLQPTPFTRLAFYQVGSDNYNDQQFKQLARGNEKGLIEEWGFQNGGKRYDRSGISVSGPTPWFSLHQAISQDKGGGGWANRGLVVRSWKARLGGRNISSPAFSCYGTENGMPSMNLELTPPNDVQTLQPGDFIEADVELVIMPMSADDYYGPNPNLRAALEKDANTWKLIYREAVGNRLKVKAIRGKVLSSLPVVLSVDKEQTAEVEVTGGVGYVPFVFSDLEDYRGYQLWQVVDGKETLIDQTVHGKDFWQTDYDPIRKRWSLVYNVRLDSPGDRAQTTRFLLKKERARATGE